MNRIDVENMDYIPRERFDILNSGKVRKGDVLFCLRGSLGKFAVVETLNEGAIASSLVIIRPSDKVDRRYLAAYLGSDLCQHMIEIFKNGLAQPNLSVKNLKLFEIPLPPLGEQKRIAAILDKADALRAKRRAALAKLDTLLQATFLDMFGDPVTNPMGWKVMQLGDIVKNLRYGTSTPPEYSDDGFPFIRATNIKNGTVVENDLRFISKAAAARIGKCKIKMGDLIIVRSGVNSGDCALIPEKYNDAYAGYDIIFELPFDWAVFANHFINSPQGQHVIKPMTRRAGQPHLNAKQVKSIKLLKPPLANVQIFREAWEEIETMKRRHRDSLIILENLFNALQQRAFKGEL
jgi:type I restriction enzyme S subunit